MTPPGWYQDPWGTGALRYFDGYNWTGHLHASVPHSQPSVQMVQVTQVAHASERSVGVALLLTFFFGPLGMLYSTVVGGLVMLGLGFVLGILTLGLWFFVAWPIQMVWAGVAAANSSNQSSTTVATATHAVASMPAPGPTAAPAPQLPAAPQIPAAPQLPPTRQWTPAIPSEPYIEDAEIIDPHPTQPFPDGPIPRA